MLRTMTRELREIWWEEAPEVAATTIMILAGVSWSATKIIQWMTTTTHHNHR